MYGDNAITVWCAVGLDRNNQFPSSLHLEPVSVEPIERKTGEKPLVLVNTQLGKGQWSSFLVLSWYVIVVLELWKGVQLGTWVVLTFLALVSRK